MLRKTYRREVSKTPTISTSIYASGDAISTIQTLSNILRQSDQSGVLRQVVIADADAQSAALDIVFFASQISGGTDNAAFAPSEADVKESVGHISVAASDYAALGSRSVATVDASLDIQLENSRNLYFQIVSRGTPTYTGTDNLKIRLIFELD